MAERRSCVKNTKPGGAGRPSIPPGVYFRMLFVGYFEGLGSQRGIGWRCADSLSLRELLGLEPRDRSPDRSPDHSSVTRLQQRLLLEVHQEVFRMVVEIAMRRGLLRGRRIGIDSSFLEANAAMKSIARKDSGEAWKEYVRGLASEEQDREEPPDDQATRRFDRKRRGKRDSNRDWQSKTDPDAGIMRMKDGRTRLSCKSEHAVDLDSDLVLATQVAPSHHGDTATELDTLTEALAVVVTMGDELAVEGRGTRQGLPQDSGAGRVRQGRRSDLRFRKQGRQATQVDGQAKWLPGHLQVQSLSSSQRTRQETAAAESREARATIRAHLSIGGSAVNLDSRSRRGLEALPDDLSGAQPRQDPPQPDRCWYTEGPCGGPSTSVGCFHALSCSCSLTSDQSGDSRTDHSPESMSLRVDRSAKPLGSIWSTWRVSQRPVK